MAYDTYINFENGKTKLNDETFNKLQDLIHKDIRETGGGGGDTEEIGSVKLWFSNTIPTSWLLLNGQAISRTEYSELFEILGTTFGTGDGSTTFNLPDLREQVPVGLDVNSDTFNVLGKKVGEKKHQLTKAELPDITVLVELSSQQIQSGTGAWGATYNATSPNIQTKNFGNGNAHNIIQPSVVCNFIIKAKKIKTVQKDLTLTEVLEEVEQNQSIKIATGQEVATNVFANGKKVYVKRIDLGTLPNATEKSVATGIPTSYYIQKFTGFATNGIQTYNLPFSYNNDVVEMVIVDSNTTLLIRANNNKSGFVGYVDIYYTKEETQTANEGGE